LGHGGDSGCPSQSGQTDWGFRLREARNKVLTLHAIPNICSRYELRCGADAGRAGRPRGRSADADGIRKQVKINFVD
jgi:hypothetical protein